MKEADIKVVEKFIEYVRERCNKLVLLNETQDVSEFPRNVRMAREAYILAIQYVPEKVSELFEDYKIGRVPTPFAMDLNNFK